MSNADKIRLIDAKARSEFALINDVVFAMFTVLAESLDRIESQLESNRQGEWEP